MELEKNIKSDGDFHLLTKCTWIAIAFNLQSSKERKNWVLFEGGVCELPVATVISSRALTHFKVFPITYLTTIMSAAYFDMTILLYSNTTSNLLEESWTPQNEMMEMTWVWNKSTEKMGLSCKSISLVFRRSWDQIQLDHGLFQWRNHIQQCFPFPDVNECLSW